MRFVRPLCDPADSMLSGKALAEEFMRRADAVNPSSTSITKWNPVNLLLEEVLRRERGDVYAATVSKAGNLSVRTEQSKTAGASVIVVMWTGEKQVRGDFDSTIAAIRKHRADRDLVLVARRANGTSGWGIVASLSANGKMPAIIAGAWPAAIALSY
jgi:hypothetical protein